MELENHMTRKREFTCIECNGDGEVKSFDDGDYIRCEACEGKGKVEE